MGELEGAERSEHRIRRKAVMVHCVDHSFKLHIKKVLRKVLAFCISLWQFY